MDNTSTYYRRLYLKVLTADLYQTVTVDYDPLNLSIVTSVNLNLDERAKPGEFRGIITEILCQSLRDE